TKFGLGFLALITSAHHVEIQPIVVVEVHCPLGQVFHQFVAFFLSQLVTFTNLELVRTWRMFLICRNFQFTDFGMKLLQLFRLGVANLWFFQRERRLWCPTREVLDAKFFKRLEMISVKSDGFTAVTRFLARPRWFGVSGKVFPKGLKKRIELMVNN